MARNNQKNDKGKQKGKGKEKEENEVEPFSEIGATEIQLQVKKEATYKVKHNKGDATFICSCNHFVRCGILCRHIFCVFKVWGIEEIPKRYISRRWERDIIPPSIRSKTHRYEGHVTEGCQILANEATRSVESCIVSLRNDEEKLSNYVEQLKILKTEVEKNVPKKKKTEIMEEILGVKKPEKIDVHNPKGIRNKGSGSNIRMQGYGEKAQQESERPYRNCSVCNLLVNDHDRRTCKKRQQERLIQQQFQQQLQEKRTSKEPEEGNTATITDPNIQQPNEQELTRRQTRGKQVATQAYKDLSDEDSDNATLAKQKKKQKNARGKSNTRKATNYLRDEDSDYESLGVCN